MSAATIAVLCESQVWAAALGSQGVCTSRIVCLYVSVPVFCFVFFVCPFDSCAALYFDVVWCVVACACTNT